VIQGSAADIFKLGMVKVSYRLSAWRTNLSPPSANPAAVPRLLLQVSRVERASERTHE
jgi:DNA polymerase I-like protein with 3'-5' exonuclease and polymerase domains